MGVDVGRMRRAECILAVLEVVGGRLDDRSIARLNESLAVAGGADELAEILSAIYGLQKAERAAILRVIAERITLRVVNIESSSG